MEFKRVVLVVGLISVFLVSPISISQSTLIENNQQLDQINASAGDVYTNGQSYIEDIAFYGDISYVADGLDGVRIIDITNKSNPITVSQIKLNLEVKHVDVTDSILIFLSTDGIHFYDLEDPLNPIEITFISISGPESFVYRDNILYVGSGYRDITSYQIDKENNCYYSLDTVLISQVASDLKLAGDYLYVADYSYGIKIFDVSQPSNIQITDSLDTPEYFRHIEIYGDTIFASSNYYQGIVSIDASDPYNLRYNKELINSAIPMGIDIDGQTLYASETNGELTRYNITNPENHTVIDSFDFNIERNFDVEIEGDWGYLMHSMHGLSIFNKTSMEVVGRLNPYTDQISTISVGNPVVTHSEQEGIWIHDTNGSEIMESELHDYQKLGGRVESMVRIDDHIYITQLNSFSVLQINGTNVTEIGGIDRSLSEITPVNDTLLASINFYDISFIDVSNPSNPSILYSHTYSESTNSFIEVNDKFIFVWSDFQGFTVYNHSNFQNVTSLGTLALNRVEDVSMSNDTLYVNSRFEDLKIYNMSSVQSNVTEMELITEVDLNGRISNLYEDMLAVSDAHSVNIYNLTLDPLLTDPQVIQVPYEIFDISFANGTLGIAYDKFGLTILEIGDLNNVEVTSITNSAVNQPLAVCTSTNTDEITSETSQTTSPMSTSNQETTTPSIEETSIGISFSSFYVVIISILAIYMIKPKIKSEY